MSLKPFFCDFKQVVNIRDLAVNHEADPRPELHEPHRVLFAFEPQEMFHVMRLLTVHYCVVVNIGGLLQNN